MSLTQFLVLLGLLDEDYVNIVEYAQLPTDYPTSVTLSQVFHDLCGGYQFVPGQSKGSLLSRPTHKYIHAILSR